MLQYRNKGSDFNLDKINIAKTELNFKRIINVLTTVIKESRNTIKVNGRHSDAFVFVTKGSCTYTFEGNCNTVTANKGDILYLARNAVYKMQLNTPVYSSVYCDFEFDNNAERKSNVYTPQNASHTEDLFYKLKHCHETPAKYSFAECMSLLYTIYSVIIKSANPEYLEKNAKNKMEQVKNYIDANYKNNEISIREIAENAKISEVYLRKLFKARYGMSPSQYIISVRLEKSKQLMKYPFISLEECAVQSGFSSLQYFCRVFKKETGITPYKYRNQQ